MLDTCAKPFDIGGFEGVQRVAHLTRKAVCLCVFKNGLNK